MSAFDLSNKTAVVTGGNGGIGRGIALALAGAGANVCIAARNAAKLEATAKEIRELGVGCLAVECDVNLSADIDATLNSTTSEFGAVDILVNNAGIAQGSPPEDINDDQWELVMNTNLTSVFRFCRAAHPLFKKAGGGKIINIGSEYSLFGSEFVADYSTTKGGVVQLTKSLAVAWAKHNIQVNAIIPGWISTDLTAEVEKNEPMYKGILHRTPAKRFGEPEELGATSVLLAGAGSDFITGQSIAVDGGYSIG